MIRITRISFLALPALLILLAGCDITSSVGADPDEAAGSFVDAKPEKVSLTSECVGIWRLDNPTTKSVLVEWTHLATSTTGEVRVPANGRMYFRSEYVENDRNRVRISVDGRNGGQVDSNGETCRFSLVGTVFNDTDADGQQGPFEAGIPGLAISLNTNAGLSYTTDGSGDYRFGDLSFQTSYVLDLSADGGGNNAFIVPYYDLTTPDELPYSIHLDGPTGLENPGDTSATFGIEMLDIGLQLDPRVLRKAFEDQHLPRDDNDDHFWWQQFKRAVNGEGAQSNSDVSRARLLELLYLIEFGGDGIDPFYEDPFTFGTTSDPTLRLNTAVQILQPPDNRNDSQSRFLSALLTVWLNRVHDTKINTTLLDGLLLGAEHAYNDEFSQPLITPQLRTDGVSLFMPQSQLTTSLSDFERTLTSTYRGGSGGVGSN